MDGNPHDVRWPGRASEVIVIALACLAPWAFGAVEAWAELALDLGIALLAIVGIVAGRTTDRVRHLLGVPSLALAGLTALALGQSLPIDRGILRAIAPSTAALRARLAPAAPERVLGDSGAPVAIPPPTLSQEPEASLNTAARLAAAWLLFQSVLGMGANPATLRRLGLAIVANATALALFFLIQALTWNGKIYWLRETPQPYPWFTGGPFISHNHLAAYLNLGLGFALGFLLSGGRRDRGPRLWAAYAAGVLAVGIVVSHSRGGFLAMAVSAAVAGVVLRPRLAQVAFGLGAILALLALFLVALGSQNSLQRMATILQGESYANRLEIWGASIRAWRAFPIWGTGLGTFQTAVAPYFRTDRGVIFARAENEFLDLLVEGGVVGLGVGLALLVSAGRLILRAPSDVDGRADRAVILGGTFGMLALMVQGLSDFCLHIPGVSVAAVIVCALLVGLGQTRRRGPGPVEPAAPRPVRAALVGLAGAALGVVLVGHAFHLARAEALLAGTGIPLPGSAPAVAGQERADDATLRRTCRRLALALRDRPDWAEGHLRLGVALLEQYRRDASEWAAGEGEDAASLALMSDPLWLHNVIHTAPADRRPAPADLVEHDPIRLDLVPATRSFLEARRCCPVLALPHAELASLDYLLIGGDPPAVYAARALELAGAQSTVLILTARVAAQLGDLRLAARCLRRALGAREENRVEVADAVVAAGLAPEPILKEVVPAEGRSALWFANRLYSDPEDSEARKIFLRAAVERLPRDTTLPEPDRLELEATAWAGLGDRKQARARIEEALLLDPFRAGLRKTFVRWLMEWGDLKTAHDQAVIGLQLAGDDPELRRAVDSTAHDLAGGTAPRSVRAPP